MDDLLQSLAPSRALLAAAREEDRLDLAALAVAALEQPVHRDAVEGPLSALAARVRGERGGGLPALVRVLGEQEGFKGDTVHYDAPENSCLPRVLERKRGLPILLSVLYVEVARRAGLPLHAVNFPGHVLVATPAADFPHVRDPFHGGRALDRAACEALLRRMAPHLTFHPGLLEPADVGTLTARMLHNLRRVYLREKDGPRALRVVSLLLELMPDHPAELRMRASLLSSLGASRAALQDLERCLELHPDCPDRLAVERAADELRQRVARLN